MEIKIDKTEFLAITKKNGVSYFIGSNGKMIKTESTDLNLPFVFGNINNKEKQLQMEHLKVISKIIEKLKSLIVI